jgi:signal peptidase II
MGGSMSKWRLLATILVVGLLADHGSKYLAVSRLTTALDHAADAASPVERVKAFYGLRHLESYSTEPYVVWAPMWRMRYAENPYAAFSLLSMFGSLSTEARTAFFGVVTALAVFFILRFMRKVEPGQRLLQVALALVMTGAIGNFTDRLAHGYVIDFVDWYWWKRPDLYWPTFNVADSLIVVGVLLLLVFPAPDPAKSPAAARE